MDRLWTALVLVAVVGLSGAAARDKTNMPQAKRDDGPSNNATALGKVVPDPSDGGRVDPEVVAGMYNRSMEASIGGDVPMIQLDGATIASLTKSANTSAANGTEQKMTTANGTEVKGEDFTTSNGTAHLDETAGSRMGDRASTAGSNGTAHLDETAGSRMGDRAGTAGSNVTAHLDEAAGSKMGDRAGATGNATSQPDSVVRTELGAVPNATNAAASESIIGSGLGSGYEDEHGPEPIIAGGPTQHLGNGTNVTRAHIGTMPNATTGAQSADLPAGSWVGFRNNTGAFANHSAPSIQLNGATRSRTGPFSASASTSAGDAHDPGRSEAWNRTFATGTKTEDGPQKSELKVPTDSNGDPLQTEHLGAHDKSHANQSYTGPVSVTGALERPVQNGEVFVDVEAAAQRYRLAAGEEPQASANRSNDPDVVAMKEIASVVLDGPEETVVIMTEVVIRSVLPDAENVTTMRDTELHEVIQGKFQDEDLMREILEGDANQAHAIPEQGPCEGCPQPVSSICSLCWPVDFCRPFASKVDIPCPAEQF